MYRVFIVVFFFSKYVTAGVCNFYDNNKSNNHTKEFIKIIHDCDTIIIHEGVYFFNYDEIYLDSDLVILTKGLVEINAIENNKLKKEYNPSAIFTVNNPDNIKISKIKFCHYENKGYAVKIINNNLEAKLNSKIEIIDNIAIEIGLVWIGPSKGFTFNRPVQNDKILNWYENGPITKNLWNSKIIINNNQIYGASKFYSGNFKKPNHGVSAITLLYVNNASVENNLIYNYRFGIWVYGGASLDRKRKRILLQPSFSKKILIFKNKVYETYSPIWFSKVRDIQVFGNYCENSQDVAIDFEGSYNASVNNNIIINSRGGALTVLNGSNNISFYRNKVLMKNFNKQNNIVIIRNSNRNIKYSRNEFIFYDNRILKRNARIMLKKEHVNLKPNSQIEFSNNIFLGVQIENRDLSSIILKKDKF